MITKASSTLVALCLFVASSRIFSAPVITDFSPIAGSTGDQIQLAGTGFTSGNLIVRFWNGASGVVAKIVYLNSDTIMTVAVPGGITNGPISIQQGIGTPFYTVQDFLAVGPGPFIVGFFPELGQIGDTVTIAGVHLGNTKSVLFQGTSATEFWPNAAGTQVSTRVPPGAATGTITVTTSNGTSNSPTPFIVVGPGPFIAGFSPISGDAGTKVQIGGMHFTGASRVTFNGKNAVNLVTNSDTLIQVEAPVGVTTGPLAVYTPKGSFFTTSNFYANPTVVSFQPAFGRANTNVLISGTNFLGTSAVYFNGLLSTNFVVLNNSNINASVPLGAASGLLRVVAPAGSAFSSTNFVIRPTLSGFSPSFGPVGTAVTLTGANLNAGTPSVRFNGTPATVPAGVSFGQLTVQVPSGASTGPISVTTADGSDTNANLFFLPASISGFSPTNGAIGSRITISGQNFVGTSRVKFNGTLAPNFIVTNNTSMSATVPSAVVTGPISVTTPAGDAVSSGYFYGAPVISNFSPVHGLPGTNVTINGLNFLGGTVLFNGLNAAVISLNNTQVVAKVPNGAITGPITVRGPAGTNSSSIAFGLDYTNDLRVSVVALANPVTLGSNLFYTISLVNAGPAAAPNAVFSNTLPATVILRYATISPPWVLATNRNVLIGTAASFSPATSNSLTLLVVPQAVGNITNKISLHSDYSDPAPADNTASTTTTVEPLPLLSVGLLSDRVRLSWPVMLTNFGLQYREQLSPGSHWTPVDTQPAILGNTKTVTETNASPSRLYRLHR